MSELSTNHTNIETSLFNTISNEHTLFAGTLRDWCDPLLQGQQRIQVPLCPRCVTCKCESLKDFPDSLNNRNHRQHHDPSCPKYHQHKRIKTTSRRRPFNKPKRRANSYDSSIILDNQKRSLIKQDNEHSLSHISTHQHIERKQSISRIPVRISSSTTTTTTTTSSSNVTTTTTSEYSPASSINSNRSLNMNTKIPRPISNQNSSHTTFFTYTNKNLSTSDEDSHDYDHDSLQDDTCQTQLTMSNNEFYNKDISSKKKKKNIMMLYCTTNGTNQLDNVDEQTKKKKKMSSSSSKTHNHSESSSDKRQRKFWHKEGRHSKSKATGTLSSPINDLSSTISSSSSSSSTTSSYSNNCSSSTELKKKSRPYRLASPSRIATTAAPQYPSLSDDSLSEKSEQLFQNQYLNSIYEPKKDSSSHLETLSGSSAIKSPSVYLIELKNSNRPINSFGLTKTITYVWKSSYSKKFDNDLNHYPKYSVEQVPPIIDHNKRLIPISSRHIMLQRSKIDYWQNMETTTDSILASSCQNHIGSATNLLIPTLDNQTNDITQTTNSNGHIISITTTQHRQPSLLNQCQNTQWNIEGDGKQLRYSNLKWYSADQLQKDNRLITKQRTQQQQQQQQTSDSTTDTGSSSEQHNRSAPPILQRTTNTHLHEGMKKKKD
ncbi:unnamed protein product [Rotaria sp. Silwood1]|nr:unnamed protein product [Rotaria sp. Silwood1]